MVRVQLRSFRALVLRRTVLQSAGLLSAVLALSACVAPPVASRQATALNTGAIPSEAVPLPAAVPGRRVAILLPLTGGNAEIGQAMLKAAQLSMAAPGAPALDVQDTGGTADGAAKAAQEALGKGAGLILGPLTAAETGAVAPLAKAAGVGVLAFTSDPAQAQPGVWTLGITPAQQVRRLLLAAQAENKTRVTAVLPQNAFGDALATGLAAAASEAGMPQPRIVRAAGGFGGMKEALKTASGFDDRRGAIEADQKAARARTEGRSAAEVKQEADEIGKRTTPPPPMDVLFLGVSGDQLGQAVPLLSFYDISPAQLRVMGPATWAREAARQPALAGAWFAAPDPAARAGFEQQYTAKYNAPPNEFGSLAYDAAGIARAVATPTGFPLESLTRAQGYVGANGPLALQPDGRVRRGLAIFEVDRGGAHIVQPAPASLAVPGA